MLIDTGIRSQGPDRSVSVAVTMSDLESQDTKNPVFQTVCKGRIRPHPRDGAQALTNFDKIRRGSTCHVRDVRDVLLRHSSHHILQKRVARFVSGS